MHNEAIALYRECKNVKQSLLQHIQTAVDEKYIEFMVNEDTGSMEDNVPTVLYYLFMTYRKVTAEEVKDLENSCLNISFNPADPMITIFCSIKQLQVKAIEAGIPYTEAQLLKFGLSLIRNTCDFEKLWGNGMQRVYQTKFGKILEQFFARPKLNSKKIKKSTKMRY